MPHEDISFETFMDLRDIPIDHSNGYPEVKGPLSLRFSGLRELPVGLVVKGSLDLSHSLISQIPAGMVVFGSLDLSHSQVAVLPPGLHVDGDLDLSSTQVEVLPDRLHVGRHLSLWSSRVRRLPTDMFVGGTIRPSGVLADIEDFMATATERPVILCMKASQHARMHLLDRVGSYPDLFRVVSSMTKGHALILHHRTNGYGPTFVEPS